MMNVMIGIDPHKGSHTATVLDEPNTSWDGSRCAPAARQVGRAAGVGDAVRDRTWAIESAGGMGYLLSQQLVAAGERVVDVPATLASRVRVLGTGQSTKNDPNDARSVAVAALHAPTLVEVRAEDHTTVCRLLAKHHSDLARWRTKLCCRLHALVGELVPGGIDKEVVVNQADHCSTASNRSTWQRSNGTARRSSWSPRSTTSTPWSGTPRARITAAVTASGTTLTEIFGVGPIVAAMLIGYTGDPTAVHHREPLRRLHRHRPGRVLLRRTHRAPAVAARQPPAQPRPAHRRDHPDPPPPQPRARLLRPQARRGPHPTRSDPLAQATAQRHRLAPPRRRRPPRRARR